MAFFITAGNFERVKASWNIHEVEVLFSKHTMSDFLRITVVSVSLVPIPFSVSLDILRFFYTKFLQVLYMLNYSRWTHLLFWKPGWYYFREKKEIYDYITRTFKKTLKPNKKCKKSQLWNILPWIWEVTVWMPCGVGGLSAVVAVLQGPGLLSGIQKLILWKRAPTSSVEYCIQPKGGLTLAHWEWSSQ